MAQATLAFPTKLLHPRYWLSWLSLLPLLFIAFLPWRARHALGQQLGKLIYKHNPKRRSVIETNLKLCFPELSGAAREPFIRDMLQQYACAMVDYSVLFFRSRSWLLEQIEVEGLDKIQAEIDAQHNLMLLLGHSVWLEFAPLAIGQRFSVYGSYKPFANPVFDYLIERSRLKDVEFVVARDEGLLKLIRALQPGRILFFLPDQDHGVKNSVFAPFFATSKATLTSPARIAKLGQAYAYPIMAFFDQKRGKYHVKLGERLENFGMLAVEQDAAQLNRGFERLIQSAPTQYLWTLKLLRTRPQGEQNPYPRFK
ncbi:lysophospholipid acyltransferase family protein [Thiolinea disciformis]|uniref:lysophospholipid acyltransferase family protein n=1 Tax=Thiolinea disciformis TaxID=125614 RepID=UPI00037E86FA|nr:lysophospholipid acyltransferase family protein [Thiolinea disciformis]